MSDYWYCLKHHRVEHENLCSYADRLGPYALGGRGLARAGEGQGAQRGA